MSWTSSLTDQAYQKLRTDLLACRLPPGQKLNMIDLCRQLSVSQGAVREALSRLMAEGLVLMEQNRGFRAAPISIEGMREITQARGEIDSLCLRSAIAAGDIEWEGAVLAASHRAARQMDLFDGSEATEDAFTGARAAFYETLLSACTNSWLIWMHRLLYAQSVRYRHFCYPLMNEKRELFEIGGEFIKAVLARDADAAVRLLTEHYEGVMARIMETAGEETLPEDAPPRSVSSTPRPRTPALRLTH